MEVADVERDIEAFCALEHPRLVGSMTLYTGNADLAAELAQEALARAHRDWVKVARMESPGGWVHRVAVNLANSHLRRRRLEVSARARADARVPSPGTAPEPEPRLIAAVKALPRKQREAVALRFLLDLSTAQTAARMGCAQGTVRALTAQGIAALRARPELAALKESSDG